MWMRKTAHSHSLSFLFFSFLPKTHDGGCAIVRPGCRVFFFFQNTYKKAPPAQEISPARKEPYCFLLWYCEANQQASVSFTRPSRIETLLSQSLPLGGRWHLRQQMTEGVKTQGFCITYLSVGRLADLSCPACLQCAGAHRKDFLLPSFSFPNERQLDTSSAWNLCGQTGGLVLSGVSAVRGSAPERFSFAYFSFPQKEKYGYLHFASSFSHWSSTYFWASSIIHSLPGLKQCLKRPCLTMNSSTGSFLLGM